MRQLVEGAYVAASREHREFARNCADLTQRTLEILAARQTKRVPRGTRLRGMPRASLEGGVVQRTGTEPIETGTPWDDA